MKTDKPQTYQNLIICLLLILATTSVYIQVRNHQFVNLDDYMYIKNNNHVRDGLTLDSIKWAFSSFSYASNWHPLTWMSHMLDYQLFGYNSGAHHLINFVFHLFNTLLLFFFLIRATGARWRSALVAALFALHPLHVESVAWVSERKDVLSTFWGLLCLNSFTVYVKNRERKRFYWLAVLLAALSLMSKPMWVTLPFVLLLFDIWPYQRVSWGRREVDDSGESDLEDKNRFSISRLLVEKLPFFILTMLLCGITIYSQSGSAVADRAVWPLGGRIANAICSYVDYLSQMVWPMKLACFYPYNWDISWVKILISLSVLVGVTILALRLFKTKASFLVGWLFYLGTLVPVIGLVQVGEQARADRYTYVPLIGIFIMIAWAIPNIKQKVARTFILAGVLIPLALYAVLAWRQTGYWANHFELYQHALRVTKNNYKIQHYLGLSYAENNQIDQSIECYRKAIKEQPRYKLAYSDLGLALCKKGNFVAAESCFRKALQLAPDLIDSLRGMALVLDHQGRYEEALKQYRTMLRLTSDSSTIYNYMGIVLSQMHRWEDASSSFKKAISVDSANVDAYINLGNLYRQQGRLGQAIPAYQKALSIAPQNKDAQVQLKKTFALKQKINREINVTQQLIAHYPDEVSAYLRLGDLYLKVDKPENAAEQYGKAYSLAGTDMSVLKKLAFFNAQRGAYQKATIYFKQMISQSPGTVDYYYNIACLYSLQKKEALANQWLQLAVENGYDNWDKLKTDKDLAYIRSSTEYRKLVGAH